MKTGAILLVEDNATDEALTLRILRRNHVVNDVIVVRDGVEALDYILCEGSHAGRDRHQLPAIMLLDLKLPRIDGFGVLRRVRAEPDTRHLPVAVLISSDEDRDRLDGSELAPLSFVRKPLDFAALGSALSQMGLYWMLLREPPAHGS